MRVDPCEVIAIILTIIITFIGWLLGLFDKLPPLTETRQGGVDIDIISIERAKPEDLESISNLSEEVFEQTVHVDEFERSICYVARRKDTNDVVGFILALPIQKTILHVKTLIVASGYRRFGVGKGLVHELIYARTQANTNPTWVDLHVDKHFYPAAKQFWIDSGFTVYNETPTHWYLERTINTTEQLLPKTTSCGVIVVTPDRGRVLMTASEHNGVKYWGFPKGHIEGDESQIATAIRETAEETGVQVVEEDLVMANWTANDRAKERPKDQQLSRYQRYIMRKFHVMDEAAIERHRKEWEQSHPGELPRYTRPGIVPREIVFYVGVREESEVRAQEGEISEVAWVTIADMKSRVRGSDQEVIAGYFANDLVKLRLTRDDQRGELEDQ